MDKQNNINIQGLNITNANGNINFVSNSDLKIKHIYISQGLFFSEKKYSQGSVQLTDDLNFQDQSLFSNCAQFIIDNDGFVVEDDFNHDNLMIVIDDQVISVDGDFDKKPISIVFIQANSLSVSQNLINFIQNDLYLCSDRFIQCETWCDSDYVGVDNIVNFVINSDIIVNNVVYSTVNISYYKFSIFDSFDFFVDGFSSNECTSLKQKFYANSNIDGQLVNEFYEIQSQTEMHQKIFVNSQQYFVFSDIDGVVFNNNICLTQGIHNFKIRKLKTPKTYFFTINVVNPYIKINNKIFSCDSKILDNAKVLSYYNIDVGYEQQNVTKDDVIFS